MFELSIINNKNYEKIFYCEGESIKAVADCEGHVVLNVDGMAVIAPKGCFYAVRGAIKDREHMDSGTAYQEFTVGNGYDRSCFRVEIYKG